MRVWWFCFVVFMLIVVKYTSSTSTNTHTHIFFYQATGCAWVKLQRGGKVRTYGKYKFIWLGAQKIWPVRRSCKKSVIIIKRLVGLLIGPLNIVSYLSIHQCYGDFCHTDANLPKCAGDLWVRSVGIYGFQFTSKAVSFLVQLNWKLNLCRLFVFVIRNEKHNKNKGWMI